MTLRTKCRIHFQLFTGNIGCCLLAVRRPTEPEDYGAGAGGEGASSELIMADGTVCPANVPVLPAGIARSGGLNLKTSLGSGLERLENRNPVLKTSLVGPNSRFALPKERVRCDIKCLKIGLLKPVLKMF